MKSWEQEPDVVASRTVLAVLAGTLVAVAIGVSIAWILSGEPGEPTAMPAEVNAMETAPFAVRAQGIDDRRQSEAWLDSYGWVDRSARVVHIPIDRAIDLYLELEGGAR